MSNDKVPRRKRPMKSGETRDEVRDTSEEPEAGDFSDPRVRWPDDEWQKTEQPAGEWPPSRARGRPAAGQAGDEELPDVSGFGDGSAAGSRMEAWTRTDEDIRAEVRADLDADEQCDASAIAVEVRDGAVVLEGRVASRPMKRRAAEIANAARDVRTVDNRLQVG